VSSKIFYPPTPGGHQAPARSKVKEKNNAKSIVNVYKRVSWSCKKCLHL